MNKYFDLTKYMKANSWATKTLPELDFAESLSPNQLSSKIWLVEELEKINYLNASKLNIEIVGSWFGWPLMQMLSDSFEINKAFLYDIDKKACRVAIQYREIFSLHKDDVWILNENYWERKRTRYEPQLVINCSSEHMSETFADYNAYNKDCIFAIQSNNMNHISEHINCVKSEEELIQKHKLKEIFYAGQQDIIEWDGFKIKKTDYKRFMVIGKL